jgi:ketosteroid isomerase-like protein
MNIAARRRRCRWRDNHSPTRKRKTALRRIISLLSAALLIIFATAAFAQKTVEQELKAIADAWDQAIIKRDVPGVEANVAQDFQQIRGSGRVVGREQFIRELTAPTLKIDPYVVEDFGVRVFGDTALVTGRIRMSGTASGEKWEEHFRYIDVYAKRDGTWQVVSIQITPMPPTKSSSDDKK